MIMELKVSHPTMCQSYYSEMIRDFIICFYMLYKDIKATLISSITCLN